MNRTGGGGGGCPVLLCGVQEVLRAPLAVTYSLKHLCVVPLSGVWRLRGDW
jgi:hypothetical protein